MATPLVEVTVAVHTASRPIARIVGSILNGTVAPVQVNVVAHNIDANRIRVNLGTLADDARVQILTLNDGISSPAGPMNYGISVSEAPFIAVAGSDDEFAPGAIDSWLALQAKTAADVVLARIQLVSGRTDPYPPVRNGRRTSALNARKDRLHYRSAPLGLINRSSHGSLRFTEGLASGEDLAYTATLWFTSKNIAYDLAGPAYIGHDDASDRVTGAPPRRVVDDFAFLDAVEQAPWFAGLSNADRTALVVKYVRIHFFDAVLARTGDSRTLATHHEALLILLARLRSMSPNAFRLISRADSAALEALSEDQPSVDLIRARLAARQSYRTANALLPSSLWLAFHRQAPLRTLSAGLRAMTAARPWVLFC